MRVATSDDTVIRAGPVLARRLMVGGVVLAGVAGAALLYWVSPETHGFYPRCPVHAYLHVLCPGCGATRAMAALLHGHLREAVQWNGLFVALLPFLVGYAVVSGYRAMRVGEFRWPEVPRVGMAGLLVAMAVFTVVRNL